MIGLIIAFVGAVQLALFGAQIYIADLVAIATLREMAPMMTGVIMAGRTGAAFAAQLGTMQVNEEIDAFKTLGLQPMEFLVLPRMLALTLMMPLLCIYSDLLGDHRWSHGGRWAYLTITPVQYFEQTRGMMQVEPFSTWCFQKHYFRYRYRPCWLSEGDGMRSQCYGSRVCHYIGCGDRYCGYYCPGRVICSYYKRLGYLNWHKRDKA